MHRNYSNRTIEGVVVGLFPIFGLVESIKNYRKPSAKNFFWFFCAFYGLVHIFMPASYAGFGGADSVRYAEYLKRLYDSDISWATLKDSFYGGGSSSTDIYQPIVSFLVSRFTDNAHVLFCIFAIVFGYFYSRNIWYVINEVKGPLGFQLGIFIVAFALITPIWQINGVRMWTALQVFCYGLLPFLIRGDKSKLIWCYLSFLIHFSFLILIVLFLAYRFLPHNPVTYLICFILSFFVSELDLNFVREQLLSLGLTAFEAKINVYTAEETLESVRAGRELYSWHVILAKNMSAYIYQGLLVVSYFALKKMLSDNAKLIKRMTNLFCAAAMFYTFANCVASIPSWGRFTTLAQMLALVASIMIFSYSAQRAGTLRRLYSLAAIGLIYPIVFLIRTGMDYWGISLLIGNPITCWFIDDNIPIIDFIKSVVL